jgi:hypothetical protein
VDEVAGWSKFDYPYSSVEIANLHSQGVSPDFGRAVIDMLAKATIQDMIKLKSSGIAADYLDGIRAAGERFDVADLIRLKSYGLSPGEIGAWHKAPNDFKAEDMIRLHANGVPSEFATAINNTNFGVGELIKLNIRGVTPGEAAQWLDAGYKFNAQDLILLHIAGVPPSYAAAIYIPGRLHLSAEAIIRLRREGLSAEQIRERRE